MKTIHTGYGSPKAQKNYQKIYKFIATNKGKTFVSKLHTARLIDLAKQFNCPFVLTFKNDSKNYKLINKALLYQKLDIKTGQVNPTNNIIDYTHITEIPEGNYPNLTKDEIKNIDNFRPSKKLGRAARFHALEQHKMDKWETKHPRPSEEQLKNDLFPQTLVKGYKQLYEAKQESIRNWIILKYCKDYHPVIARYESFPQKYVEKIVGYVRDTRNEINKLYGFAGDIDDNPLNIVRKAYNIIEPFMKDDSFICGKLVSRDGTHERFLVPGIDKYKPERYNVSATIYQKGTLQIAA